MSVRMLSRVWEQSAHAGTELLMLLAIADFADDDGNAYPSVPTLAGKCRMKPRNANYILAALQASGELEVRTNEGPRGTNRYRITLGRPLQQAAPLQSSAPLQRSARTPAVHCAKPLQPIADEPSENRHEPSIEVRASRSLAAGQDRSRGTRLPEDWTLPADWRAWAVDERPDLNPDAVAERFADHWHAQPGAKGRKANWFATWRNWVRSERAAAPARQQATGETPYQRRMREIVQQVAPALATRAPATPASVPFIDMEAPNAPVRLG